jgi:hypothetical protein
VEALKNEITKLRDAGEQLAQMITALKAAEPETRAPVSSAYWYSDPTEMSFGIGHVGLELRNVGTKYPFERSHRFLGIGPNFGDGDRSR